MPNHPLAAFRAAKTLAGSSSERVGPEACSEPSEASPAEPRRSKRERAARIFGPRNPNLDVDRIYLAEHYLEGIDASRVDAHARRFVAAAEDARRDGLDVRFLGSAGLPGDDSLLSLFSASSADEVVHTIELAKVAVDRIVPVVWRAGVLEMRSREEA